MAKDIIFYSNFCTYCKDILTQISKTPLNDKMTYICVDDKNIKLPPFVNAVPTIYLIEQQKILVDEEVSNWIKSSNQTSDNSDLSSFDLIGNSFSSNFSNLDDSLDNMGGSDFTFLDQPLEGINTPKEVSDTNNNMGNTYEQLENSRRTEMNTQQQRI